MEPIEYSNFAVELVSRAGQLLRSQTINEGDWELKGEVNLVTETDLRVEAFIKDRIRETFPDHDILAEESAEDSSKSSASLWILDPIDGTTNYAHGYPFYSISLAFREGDIVKAGAVHAPALGELFRASLGNGAFLNGQPISVSGIKDLNSSLLCTGFPYDRRTSTHNNVGEFARLLMASQSVRRDGSAALDLCYVAAGRFDGFWEFKLKPWDTAAGTLILQQAGGMVTNIVGDQHIPEMESIVASNGKIHQAMLDELRKK